MKKFIKSSWFIIFLFIASLVIWINVILQFHEVVNTQHFTFSHNEINSINRQNPIHSVEFRDSIIINSVHLRNPFQRLIKELPENKMVIQKPKIISEEPITEISYTGFLSDERGLLGLLEFIDGVTILSRKGETHRHIFILDIQKESIKIVDHGVEFIIPIKQ